MGVRCLATLGMILALPACLCWAVEEGGRLGRMEREIEDLKSDYEARVKALESRVAELEGQEARTAEEAEELERIRGELAQVTREFEFQGYIRSGFGVNGRQNGMEP